MFNRSIQILVLSVLLSGCGTLKTLPDDHHDEARRLAPFSGLRYDLYRLRNSTDPLRVWSWDIPFSLVADISILPITFPFHLLCH